MIQIVNIQEAYVTGTLRVVVSDQLACSNYFQFQKIKV
jgi:hypothetical protein